MTLFQIKGEPHLKNISDFLRGLDLFSFSDIKGHSFDFYNSKNEKVLKLGLPLSYANILENESFNEYMVRVNCHPEITNGVLVLIQAGEAAIGVFDNRELLNYKVIRKYMVRKKQGKAQVLHLNTKGKSKAGSRIRLAQTVKFFEEINSVLENYLLVHTTNLIVYGISPSLKPLWFNSNVSVPFLPNDERLRKVNWTMGLPRKDTLEKGLWHIYSSRISIFDPHYLPEIKKIIE